MILIILLVMALTLFLLWCLLLLPRRNQPGWEQLSGVRYAHRGLHDAEHGIPENSMAAFRKAVEHGFGAELDVHLMADGNLAVIHDSSLRRVCGKDAIIEDLQTADLDKYPLLGAEETIPLFQNVLELFEKEKPLIIELKVERGNAAALTDAVMALVQNWHGTYCIESFHPAVLLHLKKHYPAVLRGQLSQNFLRGSEAGNLSLPVRIILTMLLTTFFTRPDFIAFNHEDRSCLSLRLMKRLYQVHEAGWTVRDPESMNLLEIEGILPIFENFIPS
ncbi:glycerophosphodiester phosphodiesterase family protein [Acetatifactor muris]|uniref:glycerophosphodiester phosphodiesterase family protein n=1 Tax=Acetatifactor muris TaxID=879566 RepID=UPI0023F5362F|nr:glycerophosphodiester phosphodiesterase family protein [Acetatifactor muris]